MIVPALAVFCCGCAVQHGDSRKGVQHVWGLGRATWEVEPAGGEGAVAVSSGFRLPGVVLGLGPDFGGIHLGWHIRERIQMVSGPEVAACAATLNGAALPSDTGHRWGFGHFRWRTPAGGKTAVVTGRAAAGLTLAVEGGNPVADAGWQSVQTTAVGDGVVFRFQSTNMAWPHFDFPTAAVSAVLPDDSAMQNNP